MKLIELENLKEIGVYGIQNIINKRIYIGSTTMSFEKRLRHHISLLKSNKHKNKHLQNAYNLYGEENFKCIIIDICSKDNCLEKEQFYIDLYKDNSYNINPLASGTPNLSRETIDKRADTMRKKYANGEIQSTFKKGHIPFNKGKKLENTDHLKVPKTITEKLKLANRNRGIKFREEISPEIYVYNINNDFLGKFRSAMDIQEESLKEDFYLIPNIKSRFGKSQRMSKPFHYLYAARINECINNKLDSYKGLKFKTAPLHSNM